MKIYYIERVIDSPFLGKILGPHCFLRANEMKDFFDNNPNGEFKVTTLHSDDEHPDFTLDSDVHVYNSSG